MDETAKRAIRNLVLILFGGSIGINVWLVHLVATLNSKNARRIETDVQLPPVELTDATGRRVTLGYATGGRPAIVYWFSPDCLWCKRNEANLSALARAADGKYRLLSIAKSNIGLREYLANARHDLPVYTDPTGVARAVYGLGGTPQTLVVSAEGRIMKIWRGAYNGDTAHEVETFFNMRLPGLRDGATESHGSRACTVPASSVPHTEATRPR